MRQKGFLYGFLCVLYIIILKCLMIYYKDFFIKIMFFIVFYTGFLLCYMSFNTGFYYVICRLIPAYMLEY